jgi:Zn finger protein HypA/HybF involved in hydrogenase expression
MSERPSYVCRECDTPVSSGSYRAACPDCGGELRPVAYGGDRRTAVARGDGTSR